MGDVLTDFDSRNVALLHSEAKRCLLAQDFEGATALFRASEHLHLPGRLLLVKAAAIQFGGNAAGYTLDDARACLLAAVEQEPDFAEGWLELGYFHYAVDEDLPQALQCFERAQTLASRTRDDALAGYEKVRVEMARSGAGPAACGSSSGYTNGAGTVDEYSEDTRACV